MKVATAGVPPPPRVPPGIVSQPLKTPKKRHIYRHLLEGIDFSSESEIFVEIKNSAVQIIHANYFVQNISCKLFFKKIFYKKYFIKKYFIKIIFTFLKKINCRKYFLHKKYFYMSRDEMRCA